MKVKATKTMARVLSQNIKDYKISLIKLDEGQFARYVDIDAFNHEVDFDHKNQKYNVIVVEYPLNYYATVKYITTKDLSKLFNKSDKTLNGFIQAFKNYVEI